MNNKLLATVFAVLLTAFTVFIALDTFVITRVYQTEVSAADVFSQNEDEDANDSGMAFLNESAENADEAAETNIVSKSVTADTNAETDTGDSSGSSRSGRQGSHRSHHSQTSWGGDSFGGSSGSESESASETPAEISVTSTSTKEYKDDNIQITITQYKVNNSTVYAADIQLSSAEYLKSAFANNSYGRNVAAKTSVIASEHNAVLAINGDYYGARERGYVIRNGVVYRDTASDSDILCIYTDGTMAIADPSKVTAQELVEQGVWQAYSFGPALIENGEISVTTDSEVGMSMFSNPRTAIGIIDSLHYVFVVSDGRTSTSEGLTLYELADFMKKLNVTTAYNLDGGGSSTMVFQGEIINKPTTTGSSIKEREVSDIVYIG